MPPDDSPVRHFTNSPTAVILFDGVCNLCNGFVQFVIARDASARFQFGALQSEEGRRLLASAGRTAGLETVVLVDAGRVFTRSTAALRIARGLRFPWSLAYAFVIVPAPVRDAIYDWMARHRYRWFGQRDHCLAPTPELRQRFID